MEENSNFEEIAEAANREPGDAKKAWRLLAAGINATDWTCTGSVPVRCSC